MIASTTAPIMAFTFLMIYFVYISVFVFVVVFLFWFVSGPMKTFWCVIRDFIASSSRYIR